MQLSKILKASRSLELWRVQSATFFRASLTLLIDRISLALVRGFRYSLNLAARAMLAERVVLFA